MNSTRSGSLGKGQHERDCGSVKDSDTAAAGEHCEISIIRICGNFWTRVSSLAGAAYRAGEAGAQATAQSERIRPWLVANRFQAISQASMMSARLINTELASQ